METFCVTPERVSRHTRVLHGASHVICRVGFLVENSNRVSCTLERFKQDPTQISDLSLVDAIFFFWPQYGVQPASWPLQHSISPHVRSPQFRHFTFPQYPHIAQKYRAGGPSSNCFARVALYVSGGSESRA